MGKILNESVLNKESVMSRHFIVAIGASAGGLEAIHEFFDNMPQSSSVAFIIIQHLSPDYKSLLVELVSKHTHMKVFEAGDKMPVQKECIYVIPNKKLITIYKGKLHLVEKVPDRLPNTAIDHFLNSLAQDKREEAIAVILSGTGTDGTRGIEAVKAAGGMVIVQDPVTAKFDGMPNSAIGSGNADLILPPEMMPEEIYNYIKEKPIQVLNKGKIEDSLLDEIFSMIYKAQGYDFQYYKTPTIIRRISKRMGQRSVHTLSDYVDVLKNNPQEVKSLGKDFLIGVTRFFRDPQAFDCINQQVLPSLINEKQDGEFLKVWICACSTGEEAYSIAILIDQYLRKHKRYIDVKIFATDLDENSINLASRNQYSLSIEKYLSHSVLETYFIKNDKYYSVIPRIRKQIVFAKHNVIKDPPFVNNDLVSCRNMLIYMNSVLQQKVMSALLYSVNLGGYMFLGTSETASPIRDAVDEINSKWKIYRKIGTNKIGVHEIYRQADKSPNAQRSELPILRESAKKNQQLTDDFTRSMVDDFGYVCFYIDKNYEIKESIGNFNRFLSLPEKQLNLNILKMVPKELSVALNTAIRKCWKQGQKVFLKSVRVRQADLDLFLSVSVNPPAPSEGKPYTLLILGENTHSQIHVKEELPDKNTDDRNHYLSELEAELDEVRSNLQMAVESLETTNEELQSSNEELLSANEELQSSNEELQSLNEELHTLNTEHQLKIKELIELNDDLDNYFRSTDIGQIFLDSDQRIRKFNSAAVKLVNLIDSDIGRPISHISTNIRYGNLSGDINHVVESNQVVEREILLNNESRCLVRIMPYMRQSKKPEGTIINFVDITAITDLNNIINGVFNSSLSAILAFKAIRGADNKITDFVLLTNNHASTILLDDPDDIFPGRRFSEIKRIAANNFLANYIEVVENDKALHTEVQLPGSEKWFEIVAVKMMDGFVATFSDISEKRLAELKLRSNYNELITARESLKRLNVKLEDNVAERTKELSQSEERFRLVARATNDAIWDWNLVNNKLWWSDSFYTLFGYAHSVDNEQSSFWFDNIYDGDRDRVRNSIYDVINSAKNQWSEEYRFRRSDGSFAYILDRGYVLHDEYGTPYRMLGSKLDITQLKEAEQSLLLSESRFRKVFDSNMIGMLFTNKNAVIVNANQAFLDMVGYTRADIESGSLTWDKITPPELLYKNKLASDQLRETGLCPPYESEYLTKDGRVINVLLGAAALNEADAVAVSYIIDITEKKEAERKELELQKIIKKQQDEFKRIFMNAPALITIRRGDDLKLEFVNKAVMDYSRGREVMKDLPTGSLEELHTDSQELNNILRKVYSTGQPFIAKAFHIKVDLEGNGSVEDVWFDFVYQPVFDIDGKVDGVATFAFDVSDMIKANEKIKKSESRFRFLADAIPQKIWTALPDGRGDYFNNVWTEFTGKTADELRGWGWMDVIHPDDRVENKKLWLNSVATGTNFVMERRLLKADGEFSWHLSRSTPQRDENGNITLWVGTSTDIHEQKTVTEALKISEDYFRQLADQSPFMIWKVDKQGMCNYVNKQWIDFTGLSYEASGGLGWQLAFHPEDSEREQKKFLAAFTNRDIYHSKFRIKKAKGEYHWVLAQANPLNGVLFDGYIGSLTDITEQELAQQATRLLMQKKDEFMSIASHELKTPITSMKASLQIAERLSGQNAEAGKIRAFIEKANKQVNKLTSLVEDLLDVTKIQAGKLQFDISVFNIDDAVNDCVDQVHSYSSTHTIEITGEKNVMVLGDKHRLEQVIINFLSNAIKYSPGSDKVLLDIRKVEDMVKVSISDFGIGIPENKINFVFDRFFRVQESSQKFSGLGLGLFISSEIIKRHNGKVGVLSEEGKGSVFWFSLPLANVKSI
ncbi:PAS domain S-box protein [Desertivirga xinjiangensis]|uniref:PAS domain S-box protein n=1 Tax=Desertivirga xinjiangensis TaxID=539206 RepID=UPI00210B1E74|nr:PAS domain S-box protein [Pedobacter xinjiangensis]